MRLTVEQRFMAKVHEDPSRGCWLWQGALQNGGYGVFGFNGGMWLAHRVAYQLFRCEPGPELDHLCHDRRCVNPYHLEPVTRRVNLQRGLGNQHRDKTHCPQGHEYSAENTRTWRGKRYCRICNKAALLRHKARKRAMSHV